MGEPQMIGVRSSRSSGKTKALHENYFLLSEVEDIVLNNLQRIANSEIIKANGIKFEFQHDPADMQINTLIYKDNSREIIRGITIKKETH
jgi:hypothetical protein